ncbi:MAG: deoxynucleoside kinase [Phycisphaerales bacterium]|nr:deoxynucleoside kinase [Phycisphaerales bacterium]
MSKKNIKLISISGNIGSGKTTLTQMLSKKLKWKPHFEVVDTNPYLFDFYNDMSRWSFNLQISFLNSRLNYLLDVIKESGTVIQDRTIYEDALIFATNLKDMGLMDSRDFQSYMDMFNTVVHFVPKPDILIYLKASIPTLVGQIEKRGRVFEENIRIDYLKKLNELYNNWILSYKESSLLVIDVDKNKFEENSKDFGDIITKINRHINGLF